MHGDFGHAIVPRNLGRLVVSSVDNFLRPFLISGRAEVPTLAVFIGVIGGLAAFGFIGLFLGPIVLGLLVALFRFEADALAGRRTPGRAIPETRGAAAPHRHAPEPARALAGAARRRAAAQAHPDSTVELVPMTTQGDRVRDRPLADVGGKGLFVKELELAIAEGTARISPCTR